MIIVTGFPRSGTSALCQALEAGGLRVHMNAARNRRIHTADTAAGYRVQGGDVYEPSRRERKRTRFPAELDVDAVKVVFPFLGDVCTGDYTAIVLRRDTEEIRQSNEGAFGDRYTVEHIDAAVSEGLATLENRRDVTRIHHVWYPELVADPAGVLQWLGLPGLDETAAAAVIDARQYRFRRDRLTSGVTLP